MKQVYVLCFATLFAVLKLNAQVPDWSTSVAPIIYNNCTKCHSTGGIGPFTLESYQDAVDNNHLIPTNINNHKMPPWPPDPTYRHYVNERVLTQGQIDTIDAWINGGMPEGDESLAPPVPHFNNTDELGKPDLRMRIPTYTSTAGSTDDYACFVLPLNIPNDKYVRAIQIKPGNTQIVHHVIVSLDTTAQLTDCMTALLSAVTLTSYAAGMGPTVFPSGEGGLKMGERLKKGSNLMVQIHYPAGTAGLQDSTEILLYLYSDSAAAAPNPPLRLINVGLYTMNWGLAIPANQVQTYNATYPGPWTITYTGLATSTTADYSLFAVDPHMHLIGRQMTSFAVTPNNDTIPYERVNDWQYAWQAYYFFHNLLKLPQGSKIYGTATYDNTTDNVYNPNSPPQLILAGEDTKNEMMLIAFMFMDYQPGDENYNMDSLVNLAIAGYEANATEVKPIGAGNEHGFVLFPNPSSNGQFVLSPVNLKAAAAEVTITNILGQEVKNIHYDKLAEPVNINIKNQPDGLYLVQLKQGSYTAVQKLVIGSK